MKITDVELVRFRLPTFSHGTKWGYAVDGAEHDGVQTLTKSLLTRALRGMRLAVFIRISMALPRTKTSGW